MLCMALVATAADAKGQLQARATRIEFGVGTAAGRLTLANTGDAPLAAQLRVFAWFQRDGEDRLAPTNDIVISPPIVKIAPGGEQVVRMVRQGPPPSGHDQTYRVVVDELPEPPHAPSTSVEIRMRYVIPVYVRDAKSTPASLTCRIEHPSQAAALVCTNNGGQAVRLGASAIVGAGGLKYELTGGLFGYVLPVSTRRWNLDASRLARLGSSVNLETHLDGIDVSILPLSTAP
jgi:fimbrial chaperone protein